MEIDMSVRTSKGKVLFHRLGNSPSMISFTTPEREIPKTENAVDQDEDDDGDEGDNFRICIEHKAKSTDKVIEGQKRLVTYNIDAVHQIGAPVYRRATVEETDEMQELLRKLHAGVGGVVYDLTLLAKRENRLLADHDDALTVMRTLAMSIIAVLLVVNFTQLMYYVHYFKKVKLC